jgi:hypothetical protein
MGPSPTSTATGTPTLMPSATPTGTWEPTETATVDPEATPTETPEGTLEPSPTPDNLVPGAYFPVVLNQ